MNDVLEFYGVNGAIVTVASSIVPKVGELISIRKVTYKIVRVTYAVDYADELRSARKMRVNIDLEEI